MKRAHCIISGDVQGVGFRAWAVKRAKELKLVGWVKNRDDGAVELVAEGLTPRLQTFIDVCREGPEVAWVRDVKVQWTEASGEFIVFEVVY